MIYDFNPQRINFIQSLSNFWNDFFENKRVLETNYSAVEQGIAKIYLDLLQDFLSLSIEKTPVLRQHLFRHFELLSNRIFYVPGFSSPTDDKWLIPVEISDKGWRIHDVNFIGNSLLSPTYQLEKGVDFTILLGDSSELNNYLVRNPQLPSTFDYLVLDSDPFAAPQFASNILTLNLPDRITPAGSVIDFVAAGVGYSSLINITFKSTNKTYTVPVSEVGTNWVRFPSVYLEVIDSDGLPDFTLLAKQGFSFNITDEFGVEQVGTTLGVFIKQERDLQEISTWFVDLLVDDGNLSEIYGELLGIEEFSTESYKSLLRGLLQYYVRGVSLGYTTSAVNVIAGLPVYLTDNELILEIDISDPITRIQTDSNVYLSDYKLPIADNTLLSAASIIVDGVTYTPDDTARWLVINPAINLISRDIDPATHKIYIKDGIAVGIDLVADIDYIFNSQRMLLSSPVPAGVGRYYGFSIGTVASGYQDVVPYKSAEYVDIEDFSYSNITHSALEPLLSAIEVVDYISDPDWYRSILIPQDLMPNTSIARRRVRPELMGNVFGTFGLQIGDPQFNIGSDEDRLTLGTRGYIVELVYFDKTGGTDFRVGERVRTVTGLGNGVGRVLYDDVENNKVYVEMLNGRFISSDHIWAYQSPTKAYLSWRTKIQVGPNFANYKVGKYIEGTGGQPGKGFGYIEAAAEDGWIRVVEHGWPRLLSVGDTVVSGATSSLVTGIWEDDFLPARHNTAYYLFNKLFKYNVLRISYDIKNFSFSRGISALRDLVVSGAPSYVYVFLDPFSEFFDTLSNLLEDINLQQTRIFSDTIIGFNTQIQINGPGSTVWTIGQANYVFGGANPAYDQALVETKSGGASCADLAVSLTFI